MTEVTQQAVDAAKEVVKEGEGLAEVRVHEDETKELKTPNFSRMRTDWYGPDAAQIRALISIVDDQVLTYFSDAYLVINDIYEIVRIPEVDSNGVVQVDRHGFAVWRRNDAGAYIEDYSLMTAREREDLLFRITTRLFEWRQTGANLWGEAMFAKALWEEAVATGFDSVGRGTDEAKTQKARLHSLDERYFAIFRSLISRRADAVIKTLEGIELRLSQNLD